MYRRLAARGHHSPQGNASRRPSKRTGKGTGSSGTRSRVRLPSSRSVCCGTTWTYREASSGWTGSCRRLRGHARHLLRFTEATRVEGPPHSLSSPRAAGWDSCQKTASSPGPSPKCRGGGSANGTPSWNSPAMLLLRGPRKSPTPNSSGQEPSQTYTCDANSPGRSFHNTSGTPGAAPRKSPECAFPDCVRFSPYEHAKGRPRTPGGLSNMTNARDHARLTASGRRGLG